MREFKEKARRHLFQCSLREFPVVFELYVRAFNLTVDLDEVMGDIVAIIRTSENAKTAYTMVSHHLDAIEESQEQ